MVKGHHRSRVTKGGPYRSLLHLIYNRPCTALILTPLSLNYPLLYITSYHAMTTFKHVEGGARQCATEAVVTVLIYQFPDV